MDDGTDLDGLERIGSLFPWMHHHRKDASRKGHGPSLNALRELVAIRREDGRPARYWAHLEDDWLWCWRGPHLQMAEIVLQADPSICQVVFNRLYAEQVTSTPRLRNPSPVLTAAPGVRYSIHHFDGQRKPWMQSHWPGFSLNPSLMRTEALLALGPFKEGPGFEWEFGERVRAAGLKVAYLDDVRCLHLGRLTTDGPNDPPNAYTLNGEQQW
jgi:hypothetical protein